MPLRQIFEHFVKTMKRSVALTMTSARSGYDTLRWEDLQ